MDKRKTTATHKSMGQKGSLGTGMESGVTETMPIKKDHLDITSGSQRPKAQKNGSIGTK